MPGKRRATIGLVPCAGVLLTGGASRRLGIDKATLVIGGETLAARAARVLASVCDPVVEAGSGVSGQPTVREDPVGSGPLRGLLAAVDAFAVETPVLLLACDMPLVAEPLLRLIADWPGAGSVVPLVEGRAQYACARWSVAAIARARASGGASLQELIGDDVEYLGADVWGRVATARSFRDVDTPDDLASLDL